LFSNARPAPHDPLLRFSYSILFFLFFPLSLFLSSRFLTPMTKYRPRGRPPPPKPCDIFSSSACLSLRFSCGRNMPRNMWYVVDQIKESTLQD